MFYEGNDASGPFWQARPLTEAGGDDAEVDGPDPTMAPIGAQVSDEVEPIDPEVEPIGPDGADIDMEGGDELADVFQQIGDDFTRAASLIAGHDESNETPEDEEAEGDIPSDIGGEVEEGDIGGMVGGAIGAAAGGPVGAVAGQAVGDKVGDAIGGGDENEEVDEEVDDIGGDVSADQGGMMDRIGSSVKGGATAVAMRGREDDEKNANDDQKDEEAKLESRRRRDRSVCESRCGSCGSVLDESGCIRCDLMREADEIGGMDGRSVGADSHGYLKGDKTKKGKGELGSKIPSADTCNSTSGSASDGITCEVPGKQKPLKPKMKNTGGQAPLKGGSGTMKENILRLSHLAKQAITEGAKKIGRAGKYSIRFGVKAEGSSATFSTLTEALTVVEELLQAFGSKKVVLEALYYMPHHKPIVYRHRLPLATTKRRDPVTCEGKVLFKTTKIANAFADCVVSEGVACRVKNHNWGAAVVGPFGWPLAQKAFQMIPEAWGTQIRSPAQERLAVRGQGLLGSPVGGRDAGKDEETLAAGGYTGDENRFTNDPADGEPPIYDIDPEEDMGEVGEEGEMGDGGPMEYNPEAPGNFDVEGNVCPNCGDGEAPDDTGACYNCGEHRPGGSPERDFGSREDPNLAGSDEYLDWEQPEFENGNRLDDERF
jgi:hypothetical protein